MIRRLLFVVLACGGVAGIGALTTVGCNNDSASGNPDLRMSCANPFTPSPECSGPTITPLMGSRQLVMSSLKIADYNEGFDLNCDGKKDNKLSTLGALANSQIDDSFTTKHDIVIPIEMFGYDGKDSTCTKFAFYLGRVNEDIDADGADTTWKSGDGDCNDRNKDVRPGATEMMGNRIDDDCDGYADNDKKGSAPADTGDMDGDGVTLKAGDCNDDPKDANSKSIHRGATEVCGNGLDEDCSGIADDGTTCDPFTDNKSPMHIQKLSFKDGTMAPYIVFPDGKAANNVITAGPDLFELNLAIDADLMLKLTLSGARTSFKVKEMNGGTYITEGLLGGVLSVVSLSQIHIEAKGIISKEQSLADAVFVGAASSLLGIDSDKDGHFRPDIDVDADGLETFWQEGAGLPSDGGAKLQIIDSCKDGDGTIVKNGDNGVPYCPLAKDSKGNYRFVDGLSTTLKFTAVPAKLTDIVAK